MLFSACKKNLDINVNPVQPVTTTSNLMLPGVLGNMAYHAYSHARFSVYHSFYITSRYTTNAIESQWDYNRITRMGAWRWHYFDVGSNCISLIKTAEQEQSFNYSGVGKIIMAYSYLTATDSFGDMPVKEAYTGDFSPAYDTQDVVYAEVERLLNEGMADIQKSGSQAKVMNAASDLIFQGDLSKWTAFAHALKARMRIHTANFDNKYDEVISEANTALAAWKDPVFKYAADPQRDYEKNMWGPSVPNPVWNFADITNYLGNSVSTDFFMNYLTVAEPGIKYDPRLYKLTTPGKNGRYQGAKMSEGIADIPFDDFASLYKGFWTADNSPMPYMLKEELYFMKSEAAWYKNDKQTAFEAYKSGISENMGRLGIVADSVSRYMASAKVKKTADDLTIGDIMMQKYVALYLQGETWVDMRRHKYKTDAYPGLYYPKNILAEFGGKWIQRFPYDPQTEYIYNPKEIARLGAMARNWVFTDLWWSANSKL
eukprot:gene9993-11666_t